jgi:hypothetical protein
VQRFKLAIAHIACGSRDEALKWLEIACEERIHWTVLIGVDPMLAAIRDAPGFVALLRRMGLGPAGEL